MYKLKGTADIELCFSGHGLVRFCIGLGSHRLKIFIFEAFLVNPGTLMFCVFGIHVNTLGIFRCGFCSNINTDSINTKH